MKAVEHYSEKAEALLSQATGGSAERAEAHARVAYVYAHLARTASDRQLRREGK
jgi:hypothetical protein